MWHWGGIRMQQRRPGRGVLPDLGAAIAPGRAERGGVWPAGSRGEGEQGWLGGMRHAYSACAAVVGLAAAFPEKAVAPQLSGRYGGEADSSALPAVQLLACAAVLIGGRRMTLSTAEPAQSIGTAGPSTSNNRLATAPDAAAAAAHALGLPRIGKALAELVSDPATQIGVGINPGVTQAVSAASGVWDVSTSPATWDAVWEVYLDLKWARQRLRLHGAQDRALEQFFKKLEEDMAEVSMERHERAKQLVVFFGAAGIGTAGGPRGTDRRRGRVVFVDEYRTSRGSSAVNGQQPSWSQQPDQPVRGLMWCPVVAPPKPPQAPCSSQEATQAAASEPGPSTPPPAKRSKRTKAE
ncbi:hypothetical protein QJQ45_000865 [Haematococcus lacustris]|nr:hypothetical protein QJQ45_000865 [Haematococcus lacustris]